MSRASSRTAETQHLAAAAANDFCGEGSGKEMGKNNEIGRHLVRSTLSEYLVVCQPHPIAAGMACTFMHPRLLALQNRGAVHVRKSLTACSLEIPVLVHRASRVSAPPGSGSYLVNIHFIHGS